MTPVRMALQVCLTVVLLIGAFSGTAFAREEVVDGVTQAFDASDVLD
ncbi:MAG: hypothetical protein JW940_21750 [Polyangiaceae bacterium]|nr:hypothetical protein [Polyangiaceae bacterium]